MQLKISLKLTTPKSLNFEEEREHVCKTTEMLGARKVISDLAGLRPLLTVSEPAVFSSLVVRKAYETEQAIFTVGKKMTPRPLGPYQENCIAQERSDNRLRQCHRQYRNLRKPAYSVSKACTNLKGGDGT